MTTGALAKSDRRRVSSLGARRSTTPAFTRIFESCAERRDAILARFEKYACKKLARRSLLLAARVGGPLAAGGSADSLRVT
jgi:hypothetical protein